MANILESFGSAICAPCATPRGDGDRSKKPDERKPTRTTRKPSFMRESTAERERADQRDKILRQKLSMLHSPPAVSNTARPMYLEPHTHPGQGSTALSFFFAQAVRDGFDYATEWILLGGDVDATWQELEFDSGITLLMMASSADRPQHLALVDMLLQRGASVDKQDFNGDTALIYATKSGEISLNVDLEVWEEKQNERALSIMERLLQAGAHPDLPGSEGMSALDIARDKGWTAAEKLFDEYLEEDPEQPASETSLLAPPAKLPVPANRRPSLSSRVAKAIASASPTKRAPSSSSA